MQSEHAMVRRDEHTITNLLARDLVPGDVVADKITARRVLC